MKRALQSMAAAALLVGVAVFPMLPAGADDPTEYGYWSKAQTPGSPAPGVPTAPTVPVTTPDAVIPEGGLYVALAATTSTPDPTHPPGPVEPAAVSALRFLVEEGSDSTLSLTVAENQDADGPNQQNTPAYQIDACTLDPDAPAWDPPDGAGRWDDRPAWDCDSVSTPGELEEDGQRVTWNLGSAFELGDGFIDVVLVPRGVQDPNNPTGVAPVPFSLAFEPPDSQTLLAIPPAGSGGGGSGGAGGGDFDAGDFDYSGFGSEEEIFEEFGGSSGGTGSGEEIAGGPTTTAGGRNLPRPLRPIAQTPPPLDTRAERIMAVTILGLMGTALWWVGGSEARAPRLLGSLGGKPIGGPGSDPVSGLGRFARTRSGRPPKL